MSPYSDAERLAIVESKLENVEDRMTGMDERLDSIDNRLWFVLIGVLGAILSPIFVQVVGHH